MNQPSPSLLASLLAASLLGGAAAAQSYISVPPGYLAVEGAATSGAFTPFWDATSHAMWTYGGLRGNVYPINRLDQRRDGGTAAGTYPARTLDLLVQMGDCDMTALSTTFAANYLVPPTVVFTKKSISLPDHSAAPATPPAPWDVTVPFDTNFVYLGVKDLAIEMTVDNNSNASTGYPIDCVSTVAPTPGLGSSSYIDTSGKCTTPNGAFDIYKQDPVTDSLQVCKISNYALRGPSSAAGVWALGLADPNLVGLLCKPLRTSVDLTIPVLTDAVGNIGSSAAPIAVSFPIEYGFSIYTQFAALDATQLGTPIAVSDATKLNCVRYATSVPPSASFLYNYSGGSASTTGTRYANYIAITRLRY